MQGHFTGVDKETDGATKSMVCVPLRVGNERLGVMQVLNKRSGQYTPRDRVILEYIADQASVAIRNAKLMENLLAHSGLYGAVRNTDELFSRLHEVEQDARTETLTVLFADMRGFTQLCHSLLNPVVVQQRLSEFISMLSNEVIAEDGLVNKFLGDGVLALFQGGDCSARAVRCAFAMTDAFTGMKQRWDDESNQQLDFLDLGVGITTDQVILGGIGSGSLRDYTAIGTAVNLAAAFEAAARDGKSVLCDQLTYKKAQSVISSAEAPEDFVLTKPGQEGGVRYKCYCLRSLLQKPRVFISHSHEDKVFVEKLIGQLHEQGIDTWYSVTDIDKGADWTAEIVKGVEQCNWMTVIVTKNAADARWIRREVAIGVNAPHLDHHIVPVALDDTPLDKVHPYLAQVQAIHASTTTHGVTEDLVRCILGDNPDS